MIIAIRTKNSDEIRSLDVSAYLFNVCATPGIFKEKIVHIVYSTALILASWILKEDRWCSHVLQCSLEILIFIIHLSAWLHIPSAWHPQLRTRQIDNWEIRTLIRRNVSGGSQELVLLEIVLQHQQSRTVLQVTLKNFSFYLSIYSDKVISFKAIH